MCRNITELRGLEPPATDDEVEAAARQFIRKVSGLQKPPAGAEAAYERAIAHVTAAAPSADQGPDRRAGGGRRGHQPRAFQGCARRTPHPRTDGSRQSGC
jgi:hypothetical protein